MNRRPAGPRLSRALPPSVGTPYYELRFRNGYVTEIVGTRRFDRFLSYGRKVAVTAPRDTSTPSAHTA